VHINAWAQRVEMGMDGDKNIFPSIKYRENPFNDDDIQVTKK
jgi:hypothetical protein